MKNTRSIKIVSAVLSICLILGIGYYIGIYNRIMEIDTMAMYRGYDALEDLEEEADAILIGMATEKFEDRDHQATYINDDEVLADFRTLTNFKVIEIIKKNDSVSLEKNEIIKISEPITLIQTIVGKQKIKREHYQELEKGQKYIVYLRQNDEGTLCIMNMNNGKFNIEKEEKKEGTGQKLQEDILKKYKTQ